MLVWHTFSWFYDDDDDDDDDNNHAKHNDKVVYTKMVG